MLIKHGAAHVKLDHENPNVHHGENINKKHVIKQLPVEHEFQLIPGNPVQD